MIREGGAPRSSPTFRSRSTSFTPESLIARWTKSGDAAGSIGTTTAPRKRIPQKHAIHSPELGAHRRTRSPGLMPWSRSAWLQNEAPGQLPIRQLFPAVPAGFDDGHITGKARKII